MDATASESDPSSPPRSQQLQGKRPPRLAVNAESLKIKKPAAMTTWRKKHLPKVINAKPGDFMALVQRFTGPVTAAGPSVVSSSPVLVLSPNTVAATVSASARLAATERAVRALPTPRRPPTDYGADSLDAADADADSLAAILSLPRRPPGILSPAALPPAACSGQFSAMPFDPSCLSWLKELSPFLPAACGCVGELGCLFTLNRSNLLPGMPRPATVLEIEM